jgi:hypothetical protein
VNYPFPGFKSSLNTLVTARRNLRSTLHLTIIATLSTLLHHFLRELRPEICCQSGNVIG